MLLMWTLLFMSLSTYTRVLLNDIVGILCVSSTLWPVQVLFVLMTCFSKTEKFGKSAHYITVCLKLLSHQDGVPTAF